MTLTKEELGIEIYSLCQYSRSSEVINELKKKYEQLSSNDEWHKLIIDYKRTGTKLELVAAQIEALINAPTYHVDFTFVSENMWNDDYTKYQSFGPNTFPINLKILPTQKYMFDTTINVLVRQEFINMDISKFRLDKTVYVYLEVEDVHTISYIRAITYYQILGI